MKKRKIYLKLYILQGRLGCSCRIRHPYASNPISVSTLSTSVSAMLPTPVISSGLFLTQHLSTVNPLVSFCLLHIIQQHIKNQSL